jgi:hypothetical protein
MTQMDRLEQMLIDNNIPHEVAIDFTGSKQLWYPNKKDVVSDAICHQYSYGCEEGLLEIMGLADSNFDDVEGWLTAEEVFKKWSAHYKSLQ